MIKNARSIIPFALAMLLSACGGHPLYSLGSGVVEGYADEIATPHLLSMTDVDVTCQFGSNMSPLFGAFNRLTESPEKTLSLLYLLSANCSEQQAISAELRSTRALQQGMVAEAKDSRTEQKRWLKITAERRKQSFERAMKAFDYEYTDAQAACPDFDSEQDEMVFLLGLLTGLQAILADSGAELAARVPRNIAPAAARASNCLNDDTWGGAPASIRGAIWVLLPDLKQDKSLDSWTLLSDSSNKSLQFGVRIPIALHAIMAEAAGKPDQLAKALERLNEPFTQNPDYALLDAIAVAHVTAVSDRHWTNLRGERTPFGELGTTPESQQNRAQPEDTSHLDDLL